MQTETEQLETKKIRVYRYGLKAPSENAIGVHQQMRAAGRYRNTLVEIERGRRAAVRDLLANHAVIQTLSASLLESEEVLRAALHDAKAERVRTESRSNSPEVTRVVRAARDVCKERRGRLLSARRSLREDTQVSEGIAQVDERAAELRRNAREYCGVYWGTYQLIEDQDSASRKQPLYNGSEPNDPRFARFAGEGQISVQLQKGRGLSDLDDDLQVRLERSDDRSGRDRFWILWLRVDSDEKRGPIWAKFPLHLHRAIPSRALIKRVTVDLKRQGPCAEWSVLFTIELPSDHVVESCGKGAVAFDIGWRVIGEELRVAVGRDEEGTDHELRLSARTIGGFTKTDDLREIRDRLFNVARESLVTLLPDLVSAPVWFRAMTAYLAQWRSCARFAGLVRRWSSERFEGDETAFALVEAWRYRDHHLWEWEAGQRIKSLRNRREQYRLFAVKMARRYQTLVIEDFDLREVARRPPVGRDTHQGELARHSRQLAATSELRMCLVQAFQARGGKIVKVDPAETTMTCHVQGCGLVEVFDAAARINHTCANGHEWDQDVNAAVNILGRWRERSDGGGNGGGARDPRKGSELQEKGESRWVRAKRLSAERKMKNGSAREVDDNPATS